MSFGRTIKGLLAIAFSTALTEGAELDYGKDIQPLLAEHCYACMARTPKRAKRDCVSTNAK